MLLIEVRPDQEVLDTIRAGAENYGIRNAAIVSLIGAVDSCGIGNMAHDDPGDNTVTDYWQPFELSGTGEIVDGVPHIHCVVSGEGDAALGGHLHWARVDTHFVHAYIIPRT